MVGIPPHSISSSRSVQGVLEHAGNQRQPRIAEVTSTILCVAAMPSVFLACGCHGTNPAEKGALPASSLWTRRRRSEGLLACLH